MGFHVQSQKHSPNNFPFNSVSWRALNFLVNLRPQLGSSLIVGRLNFELPSVSPTEVYRPLQYGKKIMPKTRMKKFAIFGKHFLTPLVFTVEKKVYREPLIQTEIDSSVTT